MAHIRKFQALGVASLLVTSLLLWLGFRDADQSSQHVGVDPGAAFQRFSQTIQPGITKAELRDHVGATS